MDPYEFLPSAVLVGMDQPRAWTEAVAERIRAAPRLDGPTWRRRDDGRRGLLWQFRAGTDEIIQASLTPALTSVDLSVWSDAWDRRDVLYAEYHALLTLIGTTIADQYCDPEAAPVRLIIQSSDDAQAEWSADDYPVSCRVYPSRTA